MQPVLMEAAILMEEYCTNVGGPYQWRQPVPMVATIINVGSHYQSRQLLLMEATHTKGAARTNGGGPYQWRQPVPMEAAISYLLVVLDKKNPFKIYRKSTVYAPGAPRPLPTRDAPVRVTV